MTTIIERYWAKVDLSGGADACWPWIGAKDGNGYGRFWFVGRLMSAVRLSLAFDGRPVPVGHVPHHACENKACVNPAHIVAVTQRANTLLGSSPFAVNARKTHCPRGHPYDAENTVSDGGGRKCRICLNERARSDRAAMSSEERDAHREHHRQYMIEYRARDGYAEKRAAFERSPERRAYIRAYEKRRRAERKASEASP